MNKNSSLLQSGKKKLLKNKIKQEISFTGSVTEHKDGSVFMFIDVKNNEGGTTSSTHLSKVEIKGIKKFLKFLDIG